MWLPVLFAILIFCGIFMTLVPMMPGIPFMFVLALVFAFIGDFQVLTLGGLGVLGVILALSVFIDYFSGILGAKYGGASFKSILYGFAGFAVGFILLPPFGGLLGLFAGIVAYEFFVNRDEARAIKAASGYILGAITGVLINFFLAILFFVLFLVFIF